MTSPVDELGKPAAETQAEPVIEECIKDEHTPVAAVTMYKAKHLFVELHEFRGDHWKETHRWNHGLEEQLERTPSKDPGQPGKSKWTTPHLPSISLFGMMALREALTPDMVLLDIEDETGTFEPIADAMLDRLVASGKLKEESQPVARERFMQHLSQRAKAVVARRYQQPITIQGQYAPSARPNAAVDELDLVRVMSMTEGLDEDDALQPDADEEAVQILVDDVDWLQSDVCVFVRLLNAVDTGLEEQTGKVQPHARFILLIFGPHNPSDPHRHVEMGEAAAALLQDDSIVMCAYNTFDGGDIVGAIENRFWKLRLMPETTRPTASGVQKRARKMLKQMEDVAQEGSQTAKWVGRQSDIFTNGISIKGIMDFFQKYALPLLSGIMLALYFANNEPEFYDKWAGYGHGDAHADDELLAGSGSSGRLLGGGAAVAAETHPTAFGLAIHGHSITLHFIVNDIFMSLFFGLAAKEITEALQPGGSLYPPTRTTVNVLAATLGGVLGPIIVYIASLAVLDSMDGLPEGYSFGDCAIGWGIPTATDISLAWMTALCVFGAGHPAINYLLLLAIVDDGIGLIIIVFAYPDKSNPVNPLWLLLVVLAMVIAYVLRRLNCSSWEIYIAVAGPVAWVGLLNAALHPSLALVFIVPFIPMEIKDDKVDVSWLTGKDTSAHEHLDHHVEKSHHHAPLHEFEERTKQFVDFIVLFCFGAVNAGVKVDSIGSLTWVILFSLIAGKMIGISLASAIASMCGCPPPKGMGKLTVLIIGFIASAGLTVALFVSGEAFADTPELASQAKMGALFTVGVAISAIAVSTILRAFGIKAQGTAEEEEEEWEDDAGDDECLEDVVINNAVQNLSKIRQAEHIIEQHAHITRHEALNRMGTGAMGVGVLNHADHPTILTSKASMNSTNSTASNKVKSKAVADQEESCSI